MGHPYHATPNEEAQCLACQRINAREKQEEDKAQHIDDLTQACKELLTFFGWGKLPDSITPNVVIKMRDALNAVIMDTGPID
jgi:hypothetical protein